MDHTPLPDNPIAAYAKAEGIQTTELARRLGVSKGSASELLSGKRGIGPKTALRMERLTGRPWREFITPPGELADEPADESEAAE